MICVKEGPGICLFGNSCKVWYYISLGHRVGRNELEFLLKHIQTKANSLLQKGGGGCDFPSPKKIVFRVIVRREHTFEAQYNF